MCEDFCRSRLEKYSISADNIWLDVVELSSSCLGLQVCGYFIPTADGLRGVARMGIVNLTIVISTTPIRFDLERPNSAQ